MYGGLRRNLRLWSVIANESSRSLTKSDTRKQENSKMYTFVYVFSSSFPYSTRHYAAISFPNFLEKLLGISLEKKIERKILGIRRRIEKRDNILSHQKQKFENAKKLLLED